MGGSAEWPFPNLSVGWGHLDVLDSRFGFTACGVRPEILHFQPAPRRGCWCPSSDHTWSSRAGRILLPGREPQAGPSLVALGPGINCRMCPLPLWPCPTPSCPPNLGCLDCPPQREGSAQVWTLPLGPHCPLQVQPQQETKVHSSSGAHLA